MAFEQPDAFLVVGGLMREVPRSEVHGSDTASWDSAHPSHLPEAEACSLLQACFGLELALAKLAVMAGI